MEIDQPLGRWQRKSLRQKERMARDPVYAERIRARRRAKAWRRYQRQRLDPAWRAKKRTMHRAWRIKQNAQAMVARNHRRIIRKQEAERRAATVQLRKQERARIAAVHKADQVARAERFAPIRRAREEYRQLVPNHDAREWIHKHSSRYRELERAAGRKRKQRFRALVAALREMGLLEDSLPPLTRQNPWVPMTRPLSFVWVPNFYAWRQGRARWRRHYFDGWCKRDATKLKVCKARDRERKLLIRARQKAKYQMQSAAVAALREMGWIKNNTITPSPSKTLGATAS